MFDHRNEHVDEHMVLLQANLDDMNPEFSSSKLAGCSRRGLTTYIGYRLL